MENEGKNHKFRYFALAVLEKDGVAMTTMPDAIRSQTGTFDVTAWTDNEDYIGSYLMRMTVTAKDDTGVDINTETQTIEFYIIIMQIYVQDLED